MKDFEIKELMEKIQKMDANPSISITDKGFNEMLELLATHLCEDKFIAFLETMP